ncbi:hypothetical protein D9M69_431020 [compost metagenome]
MDMALVVQAFEHRAAADIGAPDAQVERRAAEHFLGAVAGQPAEAFVHFQVMAGFALGDGDGVGTGMERLGEFLFAGAQGGLGLLLLGDVAHGDGDAVFAVDADVAAGQHAGELATVLGLQLGLQVVEMVLEAHPPVQHVALPRVGQQADLGVGTAKDFLRLPAQGLGEAGVDLDVGLVAVTQHADREGDGLEQGGEFLLGGGQALFAQHLLGGVGDDADQPQRLARVVAMQPRGAFQERLRTVGEVDAVDQVVTVAPAGQQVLVDAPQALAVLLGQAFEKVFQQAVERLRAQPVQDGGTRREVQRAAGDVQVPGAEVGRLQRQGQVLFAVPERQRLGAQLGNVAHCEGHAGNLVENDGAAEQQVDADMSGAVAQAHFQLANLAVAVEHLEHALPIGHVHPDTQALRGVAQRFVAAPAEALLEAGIEVDEAAGVAFGDDHGVRRVEEDLGELVLADA